MVRSFVYVSILTLMVQVGFSPVMAARPFATDDAGTVEAGKFELETTCNYWEKKAEFGASFKHGITERMDIGVCVGHCMLPSDERAFTGETIGLKFSLVPDLLAVSFAAEFGSKVYNANFIMSKPVGPIAIDANIGYQAQADTNDADLTYGLATVYEIGRFGVGVEVCGTQEAINWWQIGSRFKFAEWIQFDVGVGGDFEKVPDFTATTGLWFAFPRTKQANKGE